MSRDATSPAYVSYRAKRQISLSIAISAVDRPTCTQFVPAACAALAVAGGLGNSSALANPQRFEIPAGPADATLIRFGQEANLTLLFSVNNVHAQPTRAVSGEFEVRDALRLMLAGSGLGFVFSDEHTVWIDVLKAAAPASAEQAQTIPEVTVSKFRQRNDFGELPMPQVERVDADTFERSGSSTTADWLRTLPQNFGGGATEDTRVGREAKTNPGYGTGVNFRALGSGATLELVNGHRLAPSGSAGAFTDISAIPLTAIDHIDVLPDGSGVLYGSDAIGGIVNFVLRGARSAPESLVTAGAAAGSLGEQRFSQSLNWQWGGGDSYLSFEYYARDPLPASDRIQATSNLLALGGSNFGDLAGNPATFVDSQGRLWAIPRAQDGKTLSAAKLIPDTANLHDRYRDSWILPSQHRMSLVAAGHASLSDGSLMDFDALLSRRRVQGRTEGLTTTLTIPASNPFYVNPDPGTAAQVLYGFGADLGTINLRGVVDSGQLVLGFDRELSKFWRIRGHVGYAFEKQQDREDNLVNFAQLQQALSDSDPETAFDPFGDGSNTNPQTLARIRAKGMMRFNSVLGYSNLTATGTLLHTPNGPLTVTLGVDGRMQSFDSSIDPSYIAPSPVTRRERTTAALFVQGIVPLMRPDRELRRTERFEMSTGLRYEHYSDVGHAIAPQVGVEFSPRQSITFRATWERLFRVPNLPDLDETNNQSARYILADSRSPSGYTTALVWTGQNADLRPESAKTWTVGLTITGATDPAASVAITYYNTVFSNRIHDPSSLPLNVLSDETLYADVVRRPVTIEQRADVCGHSHFLGPQQSCLDGLIGALVDLRLRNSEILVTDGVDLASAYAVDTRLGHLSIHFDATYLLRYAEAATPTSALVELRNTPHNPPALRLRSSVGWERGGFWASGALNYQGGYRDDIDPGRVNRVVSDWTQLDATLGWHGKYGAFGKTPEMLISIHGENLFNTAPPFLNDSLYGIGYDPENGDLFGRRVNFTVEFRW